MPLTANATIYNQGLADVYVGALVGGAGGLIHLFTRVRGATGINLVKVNGGPSVWSHNWMCYTSRLIKVFLKSLWLVHPSGKLKTAEGRQHFEKRI